MPNYKKDNKECSTIRVLLCGELREKLIKKRCELSEKKGVYVSLEKTILKFLRESV